MTEEKTQDYWINLARQVAITAHQGTFRNDKITPYIKHPEAVAATVEKRLQPIAWLHDVVEDTTVTLDDLKNHGFPDYVINAVDVLTHKNNEPNLIYWERIAQNPDAVIVKIADIKNNLSDAPSDRQKEKYARALKLFSDAGFAV